MNKIKEFIKKNKKILLSITITGAAGAICARWAYLAGVKWSAATTTKWFFDVLSKNNCAEAIDIISNAVKDLPR